MMKKRILIVNRAVVKSAEHLPEETLMKLIIKRYELSGAENN